MKFLSPSRHHFVRFEHDASLMHGDYLRIYLSSKDKQILMRERVGDVYVQFAEVAWNQSETLVGIFVVGQPFLQVAYNVSTAEQGPFATGGPSDQR